MTQNAVTAEKNAERKKKKKKREEEEEMEISSSRPRPRQIRPATQAACDRSRPATQAARDQVVARLFLGFFFFFLMNKL